MRRLPKIRQDEAMEQIREACAEEEAEDRKNR